MVIRLIDIREFLGDKGILLKDDHFVYTQGGHGSKYVNKDGIYPDAANVSVLCQRLTHEFFVRSIRPDVVVGPALGGIILSSWTAHYLSAVYQKAILSVFAEKEGDGFAIHRGYGKLISGKNVLVVEDVMNTGTTVRRVIAAVRALGGNVVGVGAVWNRGEVTARDLAGNGPPLELISLVEEKIEEWRGQCPLCVRGVPINREFGKGKALPA